MRERTILLVEDEDSIREGLRDALEAEGYRVIDAPDGVKGLHHGLTADPDLIVLDLMLPGLDGYELLARLRADGVETPVLCLTARGLERDRVKGLSRCACGTASAGSCRSGCCTSRTSRWTSRRSARCGAARRSH